MLSSLDGDARSTLVAVAGGRRPPLRHPPAGTRADDILRGVTPFAPLFVPADAARRRVGPGVARRDARRGAGARARRRVGGAHPGRRRGGDRRRVLRRGVRLGRRCSPRAGGREPGRAARPRARRPRRGRARALGAPRRHEPGRDGYRRDARQPGGARARARRTSTATPPACAALARRHRDTPMAGRTLLQHAVPTTFGLKAAGWLDGAARRARAPCATCAAGWRRSSAARRGRSPPLGDRRARARRALRGGARPAGADAAVAREPRADRRARRGARDRLGRDREDRARPRAPGADRGRRGAARARAGRSSAMPHKRNPVGAIAGAGLRRADERARIRPAGVPRRRARARRRRVAGGVGRALGRARDGRRRGRRARRGPRGARGRRRPDAGEPRPDARRDRRRAGRRAPRGATRPGRARVRSSARRRCGGRIGLVARRGARRRWTAG